MSQLSPEELMIYLLAQEVRDDEFSATGTLSPIPAAACYLAKETHAPKAKLLIFHSPEWPFECELEELFDLAQQGRLGLFFLSGAQIDRRANINLIAIGDYERPKVRLPGGAGSAMLYLYARRSALFMRRQSARSLVEKVDFITAPGGSPDSAEGVERIGGPTRLVTDVAVFDYVPDQGLVLASIHPWATADEVRHKTGFELPEADGVPTTETPDAETLGLIRGKVKERLAKAYPAFAAKM